MTRREFAIAQALARHALYAAAALPDGHPQRKLVRWQVQRLQMEFASQGDKENQDCAIKIGRLVQWFDDGAQISNDRVVLSGSA